MKLHVLTASVALIAFASAASAATNIVSENFDSYVDQAAFETVWRPDLGSGYEPSGFESGVLVPDTGGFLTPPNDDPPGIQGQGVNVLFDINEYDDDNNPATEPFELVPSVTESVQFSGDIFSDASGNKRVSVGLRNDTVQRAFGVYGYNFVELGQYQAATYDPTLPGPPVEDQPVTSFAYRVTLFDSTTIGAPLQQTPNWQYFPLDISLDTKDSGGQPTPDGLVTPTDIGVGWHRYTATISTTEITLELDLFRDGLANTEATAGVGAPGVDSSVTWTIAPTNEDTGDAFDFDPFTSLRFGTPSGIDSVREAVIDNISLDMVNAIAVEDADFDGDSDIDGADYLIWQNGLGLGGQIDNSMGDANGDSFVNNADRLIWETQFGTVAPAVAAATVPEPTTATLSLLAMTGVLALARRRK